MNVIASWLRAQIPSSIDLTRLERLAREAERVKRCCEAACNQGQGTPPKSAARTTKLQPELVSAAHLQQRPCGPQYDPTETSQHYEIE
jgi:hypothetical protein